MSGSNRCRYCAATIPDFEGEEPIIKRRWVNSTPSSLDAIPTCNPYGHWEEYDARKPALYCSPAHRWAVERNPDAPVNDRLLEAIAAGALGPDAEPQGQQESLF